MTRTVSLIVGVSALIAMGAVTTACGPRNERPAESTAPSAPPSVSPTEKNVRTNVTRPPMSVSPGGAGGGNAAVPCGFGPAGGGPCTNNR